MTRFYLLLLLLWMFGQSAPSALAADEDDDDYNNDKVLKAGGLKKSEPAQLLQYLKYRTLKDTELRRIQGMIQRLGDEEFEDRLKAENEVEKIGMLAIEPLRQAYQNENNNPEIISRARKLHRRLDKLYRLDISSAAIRALAKVKDPEMVTGLMGFLPLAHPDLTQKIRATLCANALKNGKADPVLVAALTDVDASRRRMAATVLADLTVFGDPTVFAKDYRDQEITPKLMEFLKFEKDSMTRFILLRSILVHGNVKESIPFMIDLIPEMKRHQIWQIEDLLLQLAGENAPTVRCLQTRDSLVKAQTAWQQWWKASKDTLKIEPGMLKQRIEGRSFIISTQTHNFGYTGFLVEFDQDGKYDTVAPEIEGFGGLVDAIFSKNKFYTLHFDSIAERDLKGERLKTVTFEFKTSKDAKDTDEPHGFQLLEDGGFLVTSRYGLIRFDQELKEVWKYRRPQAKGGGLLDDICAATILKDGQTIVSVLNIAEGGQAEPKLIFLDLKGKEIAGKEIKTGHPNSGRQNEGMCKIIEQGKNRILLTEFNQLIEYDLITGKSSFSQQMSKIQIVKRLPNGNIVYIDFNHQTRVIEMTPTGEEAWVWNLKKPYHNLKQVIIR